MLSERAYNAQRHGYNARTLARALADRPGVHVLALPLLTDEAPFLLAWVDASVGVAVVSTTILRAHSRELDNSISRARHQLAGWPDCPLPSCLMFRVRTLDDLGARGTVPCDACSREGRGERAGHGALPR
jgi:hypothetical protein